jgi:hypothetical protein
VAYVLLCALRRIGLPRTRFDNASCGTIRLKLLKIGALVSVSVRRIKVAMASPADHLDRCLQGRAGRCCIDCRDLAGRLSLIEGRAAGPVFPRVAVVFGPPIQQ